MFYQSFCLFSLYRIKPADAEIPVCHRYGRYSVVKKHYEK